MTTQKFTTIVLSVLVTILVIRTADLNRTFDNYKKEATERIHAQDKSIELRDRQLIYIKAHYRKSSNLYYQTGWADGATAAIENMYNHKKFEMLKIRAQDDLENFNEHLIYPW